MPDQNDPTQNLNQTPPQIGGPNTPPAPPTMPQNDLPSMTTSSTLPPTVPPIGSVPRKKFGGKRIIATILGLFLLVGGIGAGVIITQDQQDIRERAGGISVEYCVQRCVNASLPPTVCESQCAADPSFDPTATPVPPSVPDQIDCGGEQCSPEDCHCQGGDACTSLVCEPDIHQSCLNQGRAWCDNVQSGGGKTCCVEGYVCNPNGEGCVPGGTNPPGSNPPGSNPPGITARCQNIKAYNSDWEELSQTTLSELTPDTGVNFCVTGVTTGNTFDRARFTINGALQADTTSRRPGAEDFCQSYTIPNAVTKFTINAEIHHTTLGWK